MGSRVRHSTVISGLLGNGECAVLGPKGFWPGKYQVVVKMTDEPGTRQIVITSGSQKMIVELPIPPGEKT